MLLVNRFDDLTAKSEIFSIHQLSIETVKVNAECSSRYAIYFIEISIDVLIICYFFKYEYAIKFLYFMLLFEN